MLLERDSSLLPGEPREGDGRLINPAIGLALYLVAFWLLLRLLG